MEMKKYLGFAAFLLLIGACHGQHKVRFHHPDVYTFSHFPQNWETAKLKCGSDHGAVLATIENNNIQKMIENDFKSFTPRGNHYWIGLNKPDGTAWSWTSKTTYGFSKWPQGASGVRSGNCVAISVDTGLWMAMNCNSTFPYICRQTAAVSQTNNSNYKMSMIKLRQNEAEGICMEMNGMHLVHISSQSMQRQVEMAAKFTNKTNFFIGLNSTGNNSYYWADGDVLGSGYSNWKIGFPNDTIGKCVSMTNNNGTWEWESVGCTSPTRYFMCQVKMETTTKMRMVTSKSEATESIEMENSTMNSVTEQSIGVASTTKGNGNMHTTSGQQTSKVLTLHATILALFSVVVYLVAYDNILPIVHLV